jgi:hypothetical protein
MKQQPETAVILSFPPTGSLPGSSRAEPLIDPEPSIIWTILCAIPLALLSGVVAIFGLLLSGPRGWSVLGAAIVLGIIAGVTLGSWFWLAPVIFPMLAGWLAALLSR